MYIRFGPCPYTCRVVFSSKISAFPFLRFVVSQGSLINIGCGRRQRTIYKGGGVATYQASLFLGKGDGPRPLGCCSIVGFAG